MDCPIHHRPLECPTCRAALIGARGGRAKSENKKFALTVTKKKRPWDNANKRRAGQRLRRRREKLARQLAEAEKRLAEHKMPPVAATKYVTREEMEKLYEPPLGEPVRGDQPIDVEREMWGAPPDPLLSGLSRLVSKK